MSGEQRRIALLHPGRMGASVGADLIANGHSVGWCAEDRTESTWRRATEAGLTTYPDARTLLAHSDIVFSVCPPAAATELAAAVAPHAEDKIYVDANAVSPTTAEAVANIIRAAGAQYVDGGIIGPPATKAGTTRIYLSGEAASTIAALFQNSALEAVCLGTAETAASALKVCFAAWTKGSSALLLNVAALAHRLGQYDALMAEWQQSLPTLQDRLSRDAERNAPKSWRFVAEMEEIAKTFSAAGLNEGFHQGAADVYQRLAGFRDSDDAPQLDNVLRALLQSDKTP